MGWGGGGREVGEERKRAKNGSALVSVFISIQTIKSSTIELLNLTKGAIFWHPKPESEPTILIDT